MFDDESADFWKKYPVDDLALRCASLHIQLRERSNELGSNEIHATRRAISFMTIKGIGIEVGAGSRPFPIPDSAECYYGDIRNEYELSEYFSTTEVNFSGFIDAQTMIGVKFDSLDFVISAHVIEHLFDPIGCIENTINCLKVDGVFLLVVPEMTATWDRYRPPTTLAHLLTDRADSGESTKLQAYTEHMRYVHPELTGIYLEENEIHQQASEGLLRSQDIHVHAWRLQDFKEILEYIGLELKFKVECAISIQNENIFVLKKS